MHHSVQLIQFVFMKIQILKTLLTHKKVIYNSVICVVHSRDNFLLHTKYVAARDVKFIIC